MPRTKRSRSRRDLSTIHPDAAAIDIGATMHVAAVGPDRDMEPVRTFQTFTPMTFIGWRTGSPVAG
jgi:transposase